MMCWPLQAVPVSFPNCMVAVMASYSAGSSIWSMFARASVESQSNPLAAHASVQLWPNSDGNQPVVGGGEKGGGGKGGGEGGRGGGDVGGGEGQLWICGHPMQAAVAPSWGPPTTHVFQPMLPHPVVLIRSPLPRGQSTMNHLRVRGGATNVEQRENQGDMVRMRVQ